jgi:hypothetical protein
MSTAVVIALIALVGSIASTLLTVFGAAGIQARREARLALETYRTPLLAACYELQARLYNILRLRFVERYICDESGERRAAAVNSTLYVFAQFFAWREIIRQQVTYLQFPKDAKTRTISGLLSSIGEVFISDERGTQFMVWRVEQRGFGEQMIEVVSSRVTCIGYDKFLQQRESMQIWLSPLERDLQNLQEDGRERLTELQHLLLELTKELDENHTQYPSVVDFSTLKLA